MTKIVAIHQPQYLPWLPYMDKADRADTFVYLDNVQFHRRGVQNRNAIKGPSGQVGLTVPVIAARDSPIREVRIADAHWSKKHCRAITHSYARATYLSWFDDGLRPILERPWAFLIDLNCAVTAWLFEQLEIGCKILFGSELGCQGTRDDLIVELCAAAGAEVYLSGHGARAYQDEAKFGAHGIALRYQEYELPVYPQIHAEAGFVPALSALDLVLNTGPEARRIMRSGHRGL